MSSAGGVSVLRAVVVALGLLSTAGWARADMLQDLGATFQQIAGELAATFPKAEVQVVAVDGEEVRVEGAGVANLRPGLELAVFRKGEPFRHPTTNQLLGHAEQELGTLMLSAVEPPRASGRFIPLAGRPVPAPGDGARLSAGRLPVVVLPPSGVTAAFEAADQTQLLLVARFSALLDKTGRFLAVEPRRVLDATGGVAPGSDVAALEVARRLGAPAALRTRVVKDGGGRALEVRWLSARSGAVLAAQGIPFVHASVAPRFAWEQTPELLRRFEIEGPIRALALADLDGDGRAELVVADDRAVRVYRWQDGTLAPFGPQYRPGGVILSADAADVTGAGRAHVVVVDQRGESSVVATVLELGSNGFRVVQMFRDRYLRVVPVDGHPWLLAQTMGRREAFEPRVTRLVWQGTRYEDGATVRLPAGVTVYGVALVRVTGQELPDVVAITSDDRLGVWTARGQRLWTSGEPYGGASVSFAFTPTGGSRDSRDIQVITRVAGRVVPLAATGGEPEVLVFENILAAGGQARTILPGVTGGLFTQGRIHRLRWRSGAFLRVWSSAPTEGYIGDFGYGDLDGDGIADVVVGVVARGLTLDALNPLARPKAWVVGYELP